MEHRILLVDDHPVFRAGLKALFEEEGGWIICAQASNPAEALKALQETTPDIAIVDLSLSQGSGLQLIKSIRAHDSRIKILVASMHSEELFAERSIRAGANGYICKEEAAENIVDAVEAIIQGKLYMSRNMADHLISMQFGATQLKDARLETQLSDRELDVFTLIGKGKTTRQIAEDLKLSSKTVDTHKEHIKQKLGLTNSSALIQRAVSWMIGETSANT